MDSIDEINHSLTTDNILTTDSLEDIIDYPNSPERVFNKVIGITTSALSLTINLVTLVAIIHRRLDQKSLTNILIISLTVSDILCAISGLSGYFNNIFIHKNSIKKQNTLVWVQVGVGLTSYLTSLGITLLIGVDRFIATVKPLEYKRIVTRKLIYTGLVLMWLTVFALIGVPMCYRRTQFDGSQKQLLIVDLALLYPDGYSQQVIGPFVCSLLIANSLLYLIMFICYKRLANKLLVSKSERKSRLMTRMFIIIVSIMVICWLPIAYFFINPPDKAVKDNFLSLKLMVQRIAFLVTTIPSFLNSFIYTCQHRDFRNALMHLLRCSNARVGVTNSSIIESHRRNVKIFSVNRTG